MNPYPYPQPLRRASWFATLPAAVQALLLVTVALVVVGGGLVLALATRDTHSPAWHRCVASVQADYFVNGPVAAAPEDVCTAAGL